jgi:hypothetical protein
MVTRPVLNGVVVMAAGVGAADASGGGAASFSVIIRFMLWGVAYLW